MTRFKQLILPIIVIIIAVAIFMGLKNSKPKKEAIDKPEKVWQVNTVSVDLHTYSPEIILYGRVETPQKAVLKSALVADVLKMSALEGDLVKKGQLLASLDDVDVTLVLEQRMADLAEINALLQSEQKRFSRDTDLLKQEKQLLNLAKKSVARIKALEKTRLVSQANLEDTLATEQRQRVTLKRLEFDIADHPARLAQLKAKQSRSRALIKQAKVNIKRTQITAPFDGRVSQVHIAVGDRVRVGDSVLVVYDLTQLEVRAEIPGRYNQQVKRMLATASSLNAVAMIDGDEHELTLGRLSGEVKADSAGIDGLFRFKEKNDTLALGTFIELTLFLQEQGNVTLLPYHALYGLHYVYKLDDALLQRVAVTRVGEATDSEGEKQLLIRSDDLKQGDILLSTQLPNAMTGLRAEPVK